MTPNEAYACLCKEMPLSKISKCLDFGKFYGFFVIPADVNLDDEYLSGPYVVAIDKKTKKVSYYDITSDPKLYMNAKTCQVDTVWNRRSRQSEE